MKNFIMIILAIALIVSVGFNVIGIIDDNAEKVAGIGDYSVEEVAQYVNIGDENLAVLISNKDYPVEFIDHVAKYNNYNSYDDAVCNLINQGLLVYIPEYTHPDYGVMYENIVTPNTVGYQLAVEAGII